MVVVDTSVVIKWFLPEIDSDKARALRSGEIFGAPELIRYEFCNALAFKKDVSRETVLEAVEVFPTLALQLFTLPPAGFRRVVILAREFQISAYDATFVVLAETLKTQLITADLKLAQRTRKLGIVRTLGEVATV